MRVFDGFICFIARRFYNNSLQRSLIALAGLLLAPAAGAETVNVAVAANFAAPLKQIAVHFESASGHRLQLSPGSSGKLYAQILHGAPFAVFFSADQAKPAQLVADGLAVAGSRFTYATGQLALWSQHPQLIDGSATALHQRAFTHLAIANPRLAPYGMAAMQVLESLALDAELLSRLVMGENIAQAYQYVASGNAELGLVALSQVWYRGQLRSGSLWLVPAALYQPVRQDAVLLQSARHSAAAGALLQYMRSETVAGILQDFGYSVAR